MWGGEDERKIAGQVFDVVARAEVGLAGDELLRRGGLIGADGGCAE
jgi:hypothetical protein